MHRTVPPWNDSVSPRLELSCGTAENALTPKTSYSSLSLSSSKGPQPSCLLSPSVSLSLPQSWLPLGCPMYLTLSMPLKVNGTVSSSGRGVILYPNAVLAPSSRVGDIFWCDVCLQWSREGPSWNMAWKDVSKAGIVYQLRPSQSWGSSMEYNLAHSLYQSHSKE